MKLALDQEFHTLLVGLEDLSKNSKTPILTCCRKLIKEGYAPNLKLHVYRKNQLEPDVIVNHIGDASKLTVLETMEVGPVFAKIDSRDLGSRMKKYKKLEVDPRNA
jgi:hypothetical protein